jgi:hypothetical protein
MSGSSPSKALSEVCDERRSLFGRVSEMRKWWQACCTDDAAPCDRFATELNDLRTDLAQHFDHVEAYERSRRRRQDGSSQSRLDELQRKHAELIADLEQMVHHLRLAAPGNEAWRSATSAFENIWQRLKAIENAYDVPEKCENSF